MAQDQTRCESLRKVDLPLLLLLVFARTPRFSFSSDQNATELMQLLAVKANHSHHIKLLKKTKELKVKIVGRSGTTAILRPGLTTLVSFLSIPLAWCPFSLAEEPPDDEKYITIPCGATMANGYVSKILSTEMLCILDKMLPSQSNVLTLVHDDSRGVTAAHFDAAVKHKGNILTVIEDGAGFVFGCFAADIHGTSNSCWLQGHPTNFLFSFGKCTSGQVSDQVKLVAPRGTQRTWNPGCGVHMGSGGDFVSFCSFSTRVPTQFTSVTAGFAGLSSGMTIAGTPGNYTLTHGEVYQVTS